MMTFAQKALARAAGRDHVQPGEIVEVEPDLIFSHDNTAAIRRIFAKTGAERIRHPERVAVTLDHAAPAPTTRHAQNHAEIRGWVAEQGIGHFFEVGRGICHQVLCEERLALPGSLILGADSHSTHFGWLGAFGAGVGRSDMAALWATGRIWLRVPEAVRITLTGKLSAWVTAKDLALSILGGWGAQGGLYRSIEFDGPGVGTLSLDERAVLPNMMAEFGAMNAYLPPDEKVFAFVGQRVYTPLYPDEDAPTAAHHTIDLSTVQPQVACPDGPDRVVPLAQVSGQPVQQAFIGTCTNGRLGDLAAAAAVVEGQRLACRLIVVPASAQVLAEATRRGHITTLIEAGAAIGVPGCGPCMGNHMGVPAPQEVTISSGNRNFRGRMGTPFAPVYLASPAVVAASAVAGRITHPVEVQHAH